LPEDYLVYVPSIFSSAVAIQRTNVYMYLEKGFKHLNWVYTTVGGGEIVYKTTDARPKTRSDGMCCAYGKGWD